jgi:Thioesterase-like superfamily
LTPESGPRAIFQPLITTSCSPLLECDYNVHKSNSTYFSDLDISRTNLVAALLKGGFRERKKKGEASNGKFLVMLGGVSCAFRREIAPYEGYEIWSRVLCWDRKWMYIVSHFVKKGAVKPKGYTLQPERDPKRGRAWWFWGKDVVVSEDKESSGTSSPSEQQGRKQRPPHKAIFASAISKYVFKNGRITIPPELVLERSSLLPPRPSSPLGESAIDFAASRDLSSRDEISIDESLAIEDEEAGNWDWARMEKERRRGLLVAEKLMALDDLHVEFTGERGMALGEY